MDNSISSLYDPKEYFAQVNPTTNLIEIVSITTGQIVQVCGPLNQVAQLPNEFVEIERADGSKILVQKGLDLDKLPIPKGKLPYSHMLASIFCEHVAGGLGVTKACHIPGMPSYPTIRHWRKRYPEFAEMLDQALQDRADYHADHVVHIADSEMGHSAESVSASKLKVETHKWAAERANPNRYGAKVKIEGEVKHSVMMVIETGVRKPGDVGFFVDETAKIRDAIEAKKTEETGE